MRRTTSKRHSYHCSNPTCLARTGDIKIKRYPLQSCALPTELRSDTLQLCGAYNTMTLTYHVFIKFSVFVPPASHERKNGVFMPGGHETDLQIHSPCTSWVFGFTDVGHDERSRSAFMEHSHLRATLYRPCHGLDMYLTLCFLLKSYILSPCRNRNRQATTSCLHTRFKFRLL
jgi:hypothetical protein